MELSATVEAKFDKGQVQRLFKDEAKAAEAEAIATIKADMARRRIAAVIPRHRFTQRDALLCGHSGFAFIMSNAAHDRAKAAEHGED